MKIQIDTQISLLINVLVDAGTWAIHQLPKECQLVMEYAKAVCMGKG